VKGCEADVGDIRSDWAVGHDVSYPLQSQVRDAA
jgi:hypothetical protein